MNFEVSNFCLEPLLHGKKFLDQSFLYVIMWMYLYNLFLVNMEPKELLDLVEIIGLLLEGCESDHMISSEENDLLYELLPSSESCDPLESTDELKTCCFCMISSRQLAAAILRIM